MSQVAQRAVPALGAFGLELLVVTTATGATARQSAFPGRNGLIAYVAERFGGYNRDEGQIYLVRSDGRRRVGGASRVNAVDCDRLA